MARHGSADGAESEKGDDHVVDEGWRMKDERWFFLHPQG
jgi:hypothetical protein